MTMTCSMYIPIMPSWGTSPAMHCCTQAFAFGLISTVMSLNRGVWGKLRPPLPDDTNIIAPSGELAGGPHQRKDDAKRQVVARVFEDIINDVENVEQQLLLNASDTLIAKSDRPEPTPDVWITRPLNDAVLLVGDILMTFETEGFHTAPETPIEVLVPQNGHAPFLLYRGNSITLSADKPCTFLVTLSASVRGQRISTSVLFSTILDTATILQARAPLPSDATWGPRPETAPSRLRQPDGDIVTSRHGDLSTSQKKCCTLTELCKGGLEDRVVMQQSRDLGPGMARPSRPLSLMFVGSLGVDGQKHIWLQQMEQLPRARFAPTYLTFEEEEEEEEGNIDQESRRTNVDGPGAWKANAARRFKQRLRRAGVPLVTARLRQLDASWIHDESRGEASTSLTTLKELAFRCVLESFARAGGQPHLMSPWWARETFHHIADAVKYVSPDVMVIANGKTLGDVVLTKAARWAMGKKCNFKIVMDFPNIEPAQGANVDVLVAPSHYVSRHSDTEALATAAGAQVVVIPPGVSGSEVFHEVTCDRGTLEKLGCCDPACLVVGFAGRLAPEKGPGLFMVVAEILAKLIPSAFFVIVGDGPLRTALETAAERLGITSRMYFAGWADEGDLPHLLAGMTLLFNPSLWPDETFSIINIQAMSVGTPVAAFGLGGMLEYGNLKLLDSADPRAISTAMADLLLDRQRLDALADRGRAHISSAFRADTSLDHWADLYDSLGRGGGGGTGARVALC